MSDTQIFYLARAAEAERDAEASTLPHVRDRFQLAAATWNGLAARAGRVDKLIAGRHSEESAAKLAAEVPLPG